MGSAYNSLTAVGGTVFFRADDGIHYPELWKSDGTADGTTLVADIYPGVGGSAPGSLTNVNGTLYFAATDSSVQRQVWRTDGTAVGTVAVVTNVVNPRFLRNAGGTLFFRAGPNSDTALWKLARPLTLSRNQASFRPGDTLRVDLAVENMGPEGLVDVYFGALLPPDSAAAVACPAADPVAFVADAFTGISITCLSAPAATFPPLFRNLLVSGPSGPTLIENFFTFPWTADLPAGLYTLFLVVTLPGALADGALDPGDLLASAIVGFGFAP
jgi:ELWxxDGT repeat protein